MQRAKTRKTWIWVGVILVMAGWPSWVGATAGVYPAGADILLNGTEYSDKDDEFYDYGETVYTCSGYKTPPRSVQYEVALTACPPDTPCWRIGANAKDTDRNDPNIPCSLMGCPASHCTTIRVTVHVYNSSGTFLGRQDIDITPYSQTTVNHDFADFEIPADDTYTVVFSSNPYYVVSPHFHAAMNLQIFSVFFDNLGTPLPTPTPHCH